MLGDRLSEFVNLSGCFIGYKEYPEYDNNIFLLFKSSDNRIFINFLDRLNYHPMFKNKIRANEQYEIYVFDVPKEYQRSYDAFKDSKYSEMDGRYKKHILLFHNYTKYEEGNTVYKILYRDESLYVLREDALNEGLPERNWITIPRDQEIGNALKYDEEIFDNNIAEQLID